MRIMLITLAALLGACGGGGDGAVEIAPEREVVMVKPVVCVSKTPTSIVCN